MLGQKGRRLGRDTGERTALLRSLVAALILHERVQTTEPKAKEAKKVADRVIEIALRNDLHARRQVARLSRPRGGPPPVHDRGAAVPEGPRGGTPASSGWDFGGATPRRWRCWSW